MTCEAIRNLISQTITNDIEYSNTDSLYDKGILNSIRILQLILHMENFPYAPRPINHKTDNSYRIQM